MVIMKKAIASIGSAKTFGADLVCEITFEL
jgi:hypothetical protein